jgi:hypothetical protein
MMFTWVCLQCSIPICCAVLLLWALGVIETMLDPLHHTRSIASRNQLMNITEGGGRNEAVVEQVD